jgi:hypothetical protein
MGLLKNLKFAYTKEGKPSIETIGAINREFKSVAGAIRYRPSE